MEKTIDEKIALLESRIEYWHQVENSDWYEDRLYDKLEVDKRYQEYELLTSELSYLLDKKEEDERAGNI